MEQHRQWKLDKKVRHARWKQENTDYLDQYGVKYESKNNGYSLVVRYGILEAQFAPSTGRWFDYRYPHNVMRGGAKCFVGWLKRNGAYI